MERSEELFGIKFFSLHTVRYDFAIPLSNYLYPQDVSCATSTSVFMQVWREEVTSSLYR